MIRTLISWMQGKLWQAYCAKCGWTSGAARLTESQALARSRMHRMNAGCYMAAIYIRKH
ncbi:hypothetical protein SEA_MOOKITTY_23 [Arthrobacter phage MooKitty]|nr:hypothetical protein SEA_MOOKITTY_23 [Arthrobacter phage MooKitty]